jgi:hypothetical protein
LRFGVLETDQWLVAVADEIRRSPLQWKQSNVAHAQLLSSQATEAIKELAGKSS